MEQLFLHPSAHIFVYIPLCPCFQALPSFSLLAVCESLGMRLPLCAFTVLINLKVLCNTLLIIIRLCEYQSADKNTLPIVLRTHMYSSCWVWVHAALVSYPQGVSREHGYARIYASQARRLGGFEMVRANPPFDLQKILYTPLNCIF